MMSKNPHHQQDVNCGGDYLHLKLQMLLNFLRLQLQVIQQDFGDLTQAQYAGTGCSSATVRAGHIGGQTPTYIILN